MVNGVVKGMVLFPVCWDRYSKPICRSACSMPCVCAEVTIRVIRRVSSAGRLSICDRVLASTRYIEPVGSAPPWACRVCPAYFRRRDTARWLRVFSAGSFVFAGSPLAAGPQVLYHAFDPLEFSSGFARGAF